MCEFSQKLIAWLDHELTEATALEIESHVAGCAQCRSEAAAYQQVSATFNEYCEQIVASQKRLSLPRWAVASGIAAVAAAVLLLAFAHMRIRKDGAQPLAHVSVSAATPAATMQTAVATPVQKRHFSRAIGLAPHQVGTWEQPAPMVEIAIPAAAIFPPGAVPDNIIFTADMNITANGPAQIQLQPRLVEFERRQRQP